MVEKFVDTEGCSLHGSHPHHHDEVVEKSTSRTTSTLFGRKSKPASLDLSSSAKKEPKRYPEPSNPEVVKPDIVKKDIEQDIVKENVSIVDEKGKTVVHTQTF